MRDIAITDVQVDRETAPSASVQPAHEIAPLAGSHSPRHAMRLTFRIALIAGLCVAIALNYRAIASTLADAVSRASGASVGWLIAAAGLTMASIAAFSWLRQRTISAAAGHLPLHEAMAVTYASAAIHLTAPAGAVVSSAYVFRRLHRRGVPAAAITWSLAISGVLATVTLATLGTVGLALSSAHGSMSALIPAVAGSSAIGVATIMATLHPARVMSLAERGLRRFNRIARRPADSGLLTLQSITMDLRSIHPAARDWVAAFLAATANWLFDLLCLWACAEALGVRLPPWILLPSYVLAMASASVSPLPGGVGIVDGILVVELVVGSGTPAAVAVTAVLLYRVLSLGSLLAIGWASVGLESIRNHLAHSAGQNRISLSQHATTSMITQEN